MATTTPNLQNLSAQWAVPDDPTIIVDLVKASGLLQTALVRPASHGFKHKYKYINALPTSAFRAIGTGIVPSDIGNNRASIDLWDLSALAQEDIKELQLYPGGENGWLDANLGAFLESMGQAAAKQIIYGTTSFGSTSGFIGLHQYAKANTKVVAQLSGTTGSRTSIFAVRWDVSNGASIRVGGNAASGANLINVTPIAEQLAVTNTTTMAQLPVKSWWLNAYMGLVVPSAMSVAAITQIDSTHKPTVSQMNALVDAVESSSGNMVIYCNKEGRRYIQELKDIKLNLFTESVNYDTYLASWRGVPIVLDDNIVSVETTDLD